MVSRSGEFASWRFDLQHGGIGTIPVETHAVAYDMLKLTLTHASGMMMRIHLLDGVICPRSRQDHYCYGGSKQLVVDSILVDLNANYCVWLITTTTAW